MKEDINDSVANFKIMVKKICDNAEDSVKWAITGLLDAVTVTPTGGVAITPVKDVTDYEDEEKCWGYVFSITASVKDTQLPFDEMSKIALLQRFVKIDKSGRAVKYMTYGETHKIGSMYIN